MFVEQWKRISPSGWEEVRSRGEARRPQLVLFFTSTERLKDHRTWSALRERWPGAELVGASTAGEISDVQVLDGSIVATAIQFERTSVTTAAVWLDEGGDSRSVGQRLAARLERRGLGHVFVLSEGLGVNGSELVEGLVERLGPHVGLTGGLSGDGPRFGETAIGLGDPGRRARAVAVGFHGEALRVGVGSLGGWDPFGIERCVTRSRGNVLYELDGRPALDLYREYLGEHACGLPATGLLYPLKIRADPSRNGIVRTILSVDPTEGSMTFAGDLPTGSYAQLMKASFDRLVDGAAGAARSSLETLGERQPDLAILVSCVGRKLVLQQRIEEELEGVREVLEQAILTGFYSYGEIAPFTAGARCELHNQTMTITTFLEEPCTSC